MGIQPLLVLEKGAKRQGNLPVLVSLRARRECPGITQDIAPMLDKLRLAVARMVLHQCASNRRHDCHPYRLSSHRVMPVMAEICHSAFSVAGQY
jgi:hypothetical protein